MEVIRAWGPPFADGWQDWRPDPSWPYRPLPEDWDRTARARVRHRETLDAPPGGKRRIVLRKGAADGNSRSARRA